MEKLSKPFPATELSVAAARAFVGRLFTGRAEYDDAYLLASELAQNAVRYGTGTTFRVTVTFDDDQATVTVTNAGTGTLPNPAAVALNDLDAEGGRGLGLMAMLATSYGASTGRGQTTVWFTLPRTARPLAA